MCTHVQAAYILLQLEYYIYVLERARNVQNASKWNAICFGEYAERFDY